MLCWGNTLTTKCDNMVLTTRRTTCWTHRKELTMPLNEFVDSARMAKAAGMGLPSFRVALTRSKSRREAGNELPTDVPEPDIIIGRSPVWSVESLEKWLAARESSRQAVIDRREEAEKARGTEDVRREVHHAILISEGRR